MRTLIAILLLCAPAVAQDYYEHGEDRIPVYGRDYTHRAVADGDLTDPQTWEPAELPNADDVLWIPSERTVHLHGSATVMDVLVEGHLRLHEGHSLRVRTLTVLGAGHGGESGHDHGHLHQSGAGEIVIRDTPIDTYFDPEQWGNGVLVLDGVWTTRERLVVPHAAVSHDLVAGQPLNLVLPDGWDIGDRLVIPDTRQPSQWQDLSPENSHTEVVEIADAVGGMIVLAEPMEHDHLLRRTRDGLPSPDQVIHVCNLDAPDIVVRSENPNGVRGHTVTVGHGTVDRSNVAFRGLGRTTTDPLDNTTFDEDGNVLHVGTNQIARYAEHKHHVLGPHTDTFIEDPLDAINVDRQWRDRCHVVEGSPKWGVVVHGTHHGQFSDSFIYDCAGAHLVTESAGEFANVLTNNVIVGYRDGSGQRTTPQGGTKSSITARAHRNERGGDHWHNRVGFALESMMNVFSGCAIYGCEDAIGMAGFGTTTLHPKRYPGRNVRDIYPLTRIKDFANHRDRKVYPFLWPSHDVHVTGCLRGIETWSAHCYPPDYPVSENSMGMDFKGWHMFPGLRLIHCHQPTDLEDQDETYLKDWKIRGDFSKIEPLTHRDRNYALFFKDGYRFGITLQNCELSGYSVAYGFINDLEETRFLDCRIDCPQVMTVPLHQQAKAAPWQATPGFRMLWQDCEFAGVETLIAGRGLRHAFNRDNIPLLNPRSIEFRPLNGVDIDLYSEEQHPDWEHPGTPGYPDPSDLPEGGHWNDWPEGVWTQQQLIDLGTPIFGKAIPPWGYQSDLTGPSFWLAETHEQDGILRRIEALEQTVFGGN